MPTLPVVKTYLCDALRTGPALALASLLSACSGSPPTDIGVHNGHLTGCPPSPNCVSSQANDAEHHIAPLSLSGSPAQTRARLLSILSDSPRVKIVTQQDNYLHAEFTSRIMRFVDDVEFYIQPQTVEVRSASRLGESDFGVNRERIEQLRQRLQQP